MTTVNLDDKELPGWVKWCKRQWGALLHLTAYLITSTADHGIEIAARAIGIFAPLPNSISVYNISQPQLGFNGVQAFAFALVIEMIVFALVEIALYLFDGLLRDATKYRVPFALSVASVVVGVSIVIGIVYNLEAKGDGNTIMAWLPVISLCAFLSIGLKRWHERQKEAVATRKAKPAKSPEISGNSGASIDQMNEAKREKVRKRLAEITAIISENGPMTVSEIAALLSVTVSDKTLSNDLNALAGEGKIDKEGRKWKIRGHITGNLPAAPAPVLNGHSK